MLLISVSLMLMLSSIILLCQRAEIRLLKTEVRGYQMCNGRLNRAMEKAGHGRLSAAEARAVGIANLPTEKN